MSPWANSIVKNKRTGDLFRLVRWHHVEGTEYAIAFLIPLNSTNPKPNWVTEITLEEGYAVVTEPSEWKVGDKFHLPGRELVYEILAIYKSSVWVLQPLTGTTATYQMEYLDRDAVRA
jgi:hypothetical protein